MENIIYSSVSALHAALISGQTTSLELVYYARERIAAYDQNSPALNAVLELNPQAEAIAAALDAEIRAGKIRGMLHGIPILLKDNIDTCDMMHTSAGSLALKGRYAPKDAFIVQKLRDAGAVILGKANMTEFANYIAHDMPNGYSSRGGQVKNPWGGDPSGSSSGSAVSVAALYVPLSIGTETLGSIISPASECGVVGIKPTVGLVSRRGILPISISQDTAGPMGRNVLDCAIALDAMIGEDPSDPYTLHGMPAQDYAQAVRNAPNSLENITIGLFNKKYDGNPSRTSAFLSALHTLSELGADIVEVELSKYDNNAIDAVFSNEFRACMDSALVGSIGSPVTLAEIAAYNVAHPEECLCHGQACFDDALLPGKGFHAPEYIAARQAIRENTTLSIAKIFEEKNLSAIITPECSFFAVAGFPSVVLPVGVEDGRPIPLVLNGCAFSEARLLAIAAALERRIGTGTQPI